jgi:hypothetical protein
VSRGSAQRTVKAGDGFRSWKPSPAFFMGAVPGVGDRRPAGGGSSFRHGSRCVHSSVENFSSHLARAAVEIVLGDRPLGGGVLVPEVVEEHVKDL